MGSSRIHEVSHGSVAQFMVKRTSVEFTTSMGPLFCVVSKRPTGKGRPRRLADGWRTVLENRCDIFITNVLTKSFRDLSCPLTPGFPGHLSLSKLIYVRILPLDADGYRVLLMFNNPETSAVNTLLYNSRLKAWTTNESSLGMHCNFSSHGIDYIDEKLFCIFGNLELWVYDIVKSSWTGMPWDSPAGIRHGAMLRCGSKVMLTIWATTDFEAEDVEKACSRGFYATQGSILIYRINPDSLTVEHKYTSPPSVTEGICPVWDGSRVHFAADVNSIYLGTSRHPQYSVLRFDFRTQEWNHIRLPSRKHGDLDLMLWGNVPFEPGLNPSLEV